MMAAASAAGVAFNHIAARYDELFTHSVIGRAQREVVWATLQREVRAGDYVLDLNCGTGEDAMYLSRLGAQVVGIDVSEAMIKISRAKALSREVPAEFFELKIEDVDRVPRIRAFDLVLSNFSGLNCVADIAGIAMRLARVMRSGGRLLLCVSTRVCAFETAYYVARGEFRKAIRRWSGSSAPTVAGHSVPVWYRTIGELRHSMRGHFQITGVEAVGLCVPPSYLEAWAAQHARVIDTMKQFDRRLGRIPILRGFGDHVLLEFRRSDT